MNTPQPPLTPDDVDTLLSAELDGEFESAARDLALSAAEARDRLDATPGVDERRHAITRARDLIATPPPLSSTLEDRLIATAMAPEDLATKREQRGERDRARTSRRIFIAAGSVAAAIAVVVGVANMRSPDSAKSSANALRTGAGASNAKPALGSDLYVDFGDVTNDAGLEAQANRVLLQQRRSVNGQAAAPEANTTSTPKAAAASGATDTHGVSADKAPDTPAPMPPAFAVEAHSCVDTVRQRYAISSEPAIVGTGTFSGTRVAILVFGRNDAAVAYILNPQTCALVRKQPLG
jgi:hypothetical protein